MATLTIRNLPDAVHQALRRRAAENARSVEAEVRALLSVAVGASGVAEDHRAFRPDATAPSAIGMWGRSEPGRSEVDRFIAQRRLDAALEGDEITAEEHADLSARIDAWALDLKHLDSILDQRRRAT